MFLGENMNLGTVHRFFLSSLVKNFRVRKFFIEFGCVIELGLDFFRVRVIFRVWVSSYVHVYRV